MCSTNSSGLACTLRNLDETCDLVNAAVPVLNSILILEIGFCPAILLDTNTVYHRVYGLREKGTSKPPKRKSRAKEKKLTPTTPD